MVFFSKAVLLFICVFIASGDRCHSNTSTPIALYSHQTAYDSASHVLYLFGGRESKSSFLNSIYKWNTIPNAWTELSTTTPTNMFYSWINSAVTIQDIVYFIGMDDDSYTSGKVYRFHLSTEQWLSPDNIAMPIHPSIRGCVTHNTSHILMVGGQTGSNTFIDQLQIYSVSSNVWSTETINVSPIHGQGWICGYCYSIGIDLYVFGGASTESDSDLIDDMFKYNPTDKWTSIGNLPQVQGYGSAVYDERSRSIYLVGGWSGNLMDTIYVFDVETETITDTWTMQHTRDSLATQIIDDDLYVFGGEEHVDVPVSSIEVCVIPQLITMDPTTDPSVSPTRNPSRSPTDNPSKYPTKQATTNPYTRNPSVSPTQPPSAHLISRSTNKPSHPTLRADIPSSPESITTAYLTDESLSTGTEHNTVSGGDRTEEPSLSMIMMWMFGSSIVIVCVLGCVILIICNMIRKRRRADVMHLEVVSPSVAVKNTETTKGVSTNADVIEIYDDENRYETAMDNNSGGILRTEGSNENVNQLVTHTDGHPNIAADEFIVIGDDEDQNEDTNQGEENTTQGFGNEHVDEVVSARTKY